MTRKKNQNKSDFVNLFLLTAEHDSSDKNKAKEFLASEGVNVDRMLSEGLQRIKQMQLMINAKRTGEEMQEAEKLKEQAIQWVDSLLNSKRFSLAELVKEEELTVSFSKVEDLSPEDIRIILIRHFTLKFLKQQRGQR